MAWHLTADAAMPLTATRSVCGAALHDRVVHMTYTERGENLHVLSLREATKHEARYYFKVLAHE